MKTLNQLREEIKSNVVDVINHAPLSQVEINELDVDAVCELLDNNHYYHEVIYYADAWEVVAGSSFNNYSAEGLDFSSCTSALDCVMQEANSILNSAYYGEREDIIQDYLDGIQTEDVEMYSKSESRLNGLYWAETDNGNMLSFNTQDELYAFLNNQ